jgi:elongation factor Ts
VHLGSKLGVIAEDRNADGRHRSRSGRQELAATSRFHLAACRPPYPGSRAVPGGRACLGRTIYAKQVENKPANIVEKDRQREGREFFSTVCFLEQPFVKDGDVTVTHCSQPKARKPVTR